MKPEEGVTDMQLDLKQPEDWFTEFGMLVLEGRVPCNNAQGHSRGPHCPSMDGSPVEWVHDNCSTHDKLCKRAAQWKQQMMQMFHNDLPMMLEVLVYPNCTHGDDQVFATSATSGPPGAKGFLLEQWTIQILPKRDFGNPISTYMLMQAVRSYLHFSQLSAWWNLTHGTSPCKVGYRLCVPGEAVCSVFDGPADQHVFPSPSICKTSAMKISVTSLPRCSDIPIPRCMEVVCADGGVWEGSDTAAAGNTGARRKTKAADRKEKESHGVPLKADVATSHRCPTFDAPEHRSSPPVDIPDRYTYWRRMAKLSDDSDDDCSPVDRRESGRRQDGSVRQRRPTGPFCAGDKLSLAPADVLCGESSATSGEVVPPVGSYMVACNRLEVEYDNAPRLRGGDDAWRAADGKYQRAAGGQSSAAAAAYAASADGGALDRGRERYKKCGGGGGGAEGTYSRVGFYRRDVADDDGERESGHMSRKLKWLKQKELMRRQNLEKTSSSCAASGERAGEAAAAAVAAAATPAAVTRDTACDSQQTTSEASGNGTVMPAPSNNGALMPGASNNRTVMLAGSNNGALMPGASNNRTVMPAASNNGALMPGASNNRTVMLAGSNNGALMPGASNNRTVIPAASNNGALMPGASNNGTVMPAASNNGALMPRASNNGTVMPAASNTRTFIPEASVNKALMQGAGNNGTLMPGSSDNTTLMPAASDNRTCEPVALNKYRLPESRGERSARAVDRPQRGDPSRGLHDRVTRDCDKKLTCDSASGTLDNPTVSVKSDPVCRDGKRQGSDYRKQGGRQDGPQERAWDRRNRSRAASDSSLQAFQPLMDTDPRCKFYLPAEDDGVTLRHLEQQIAVTQRCLRRSSFSMEASAICHVSDVSSDVARQQRAATSGDVVARGVGRGATAVVEEGVARSVEGVARSVDGGAATATSGEVARGVDRAAASTFGDLRGFSYNECLAEGLDTSLSSLSQFSDVSERSFDADADSLTAFRSQHCSTPDFRLLLENSAAAVAPSQRGGSGERTTSSSSLSSSFSRLDGSLLDSELAACAFSSRVPRSPTDARAGFPPPVAAAPADSSSRSAKSLSGSLWRCDKEKEKAGEVGIGLRGSAKRIPTDAERLSYRRSLDSAASMIFHQRTGLPSSSSPAPLRRGNSSFEFDPTLTKVCNIKYALSCSKLDSKNDDVSLPGSGKVLSTSAPASSSSSLLGNFEESVLNGRLEPVGTVEGFSAEIGASGVFCPTHITLPITTFFYHVSEDDAPSPFLGHVNLGKKGYRVPSKGTVQVTLFNPNKTVVKMFVVMYDLADMPPNCQTFVRQRIFYMPTGATSADAGQLRFLIHLRFASSKSGKVYLHTDIRMLFSRSADLDTSVATYELRSFTEVPVNPRFSPRK